MLNKNILRSKKILGKEYPAEGEEAIMLKMVKQLTDQLDRMYKDGQKTLRQIHPKMNGCVKAEFIIESSLPDRLRKGLFKEGKAYPAWIRFSNGSTHPKPDYKKDVRGIAIKLMNVPGEKLIGPLKSEGTQDFLAWSSETFFSRDIKQFSKTLKAATSPSKINLLLYFLNPMHLKLTREVLRSFIKCRHPFEIYYFSTTPFQFGDDDTAVKYLIKPSDQNKLEYTDEKNKDYLRHNMRATLEKNEILFDFSVQFQEDADSMPIEDPTIQWKSPFLKVATIRIPQQVFDTPEQNEFGENLTFNIWHSLPEHRPLGGFNRARRRIYEELYKYRLNKNKLNPPEPTAGDDFFDSTGQTYLKPAT